MRKLNETGSLLVPLVIVVVLLFSSLGFGLWAFMGMQDYKNNSDKKSAVAASAAANAEAKKKDAEFAETEKSPLKTYTGPSTFGTVSFEYSKKWSAYVSETGKGIALIDGYFSYNYVPDIASENLFALRVQVVNTPYETVLKTFDTVAKTGKISVVSFRADKVPAVLGSKLTGALDAKKSGTMVLIPLRDKTLKIWTEGSDSLNDFNTIILPSLSFIP
jgi:hypothetical protein